MFKSMQQTAFFSLYFQTLFSLFFIDMRGKKEEEKKNHLNKIFEVNNATYEQVFFRKNGISL